MTKIAKEFFKKVEDQAKAEGIRLGKKTHGRLRLWGTAIGVFVVILLAVWIAYQR